MHNVYLAFAAVSCSPGKNLLNPEMPVHGHICVIGEMGGDYMEFLGGVCEKQRLCWLWKLRCLSVLCIV